MIIFATLLEGAVLWATWGFILPAVSYILALQMGTWVAYAIYATFTEGDLLVPQNTAQAPAPALAVPEPALAVPVPALVAEPEEDDARTLVSMVKAGVGDADVVRLADYRPQAS